MIFIASAEVKPLPGSQMKDRGVGASVYCLIPAESESAGEAKLRSCLEQDKYRLIKLEFLKKYEMCLNIRDLNIYIRDSDWSNASCTTSKPCSLRRDGMLPRYFPLA